MRAIESLRAAPTTAAAALAVCLCLPGLAAADPGKRCSERILKGEYVFTGTGFTRPPGSLPGTPWVPKAIVEVIHFNGDGTLTTPFVAIANPFGDVGNVLQPPGGGAAGLYTVNDDCTGTVHFLDVNNVTYAIFVDPPEGHTVWMIQRSPDGNPNPVNNVFQGTAKRVR